MSLISLASKGVLGRLPERSEPLGLQQSFPGVHRVIIYSTAQHRINPDVVTAAEPLNETFWFRRAP